MGEHTLAGRPAREPVEPSATERRFARTLYATFVALTETGFTRGEAMEIVVATVAGTASNDAVTGDARDD